MVGDAVGLEVVVQQNDLGYAFRMSLNQIVSKIPKPVLVIGVLTLALVAIVFNNPLKDECEVKTTNFLKEVRGIITSVRAKDKTQFAQLGFWMDRCKQGNSQGACEDYFSGLRKLTTALTVFPEKCQSRYSEENENFISYLINGIQVMSLVAWGERPPNGVADRAGWLTEADLKTFCRLKKTFYSLAKEEDFTAVKNKVYLQYPDAWPETVLEKSRDPENRPMALKTAANPTGTLDVKQIYERSLFSIRCDLYE